MANTEPTSLYRGRQGLSLTLLSSCVARVWIHDPIVDSGTWEGNLLREEGDFDSQKGGTRRSPLPFSHFEQCHMIWGLQVRSCHFSLWPQEDDQESHREKHLWCHQRPPTTLEPYCLSNITSGIWWLCSQSLADLLALGLASNSQTPSLTTMCGRERSLVILPQ